MESWSRRLPPLGRVAPPCPNWGSRKMIQPGSIRWPRPPLTMGSPEAPPQALRCSDPAGACREKKGDEFSPITLFALRACQRALVITDTSDTMGSWSKEAGRVYLDRLFFH